MISTNRNLNNKKEAFLLTQIKKYLGQSWIIGDQDVRILNKAKGKKISCSVNYRKCYAFSVSYLNVNREIDELIGVQ